MINRLLRAFRRTSNRQALVVTMIGRRLIREVDCGGRTLAAFVTKTAPLLGLAGTLLGISASLSSFSSNPEASEEIISGFAMAITTTLWGVMIACLAMVTSRLVWQPAIGRAEDLIGELLDEVSQRIRQPKASKKEPKQNPKRNRIFFFKRSPVNGLHRRKGGRRVRRI